MRRGRAAFTAMLARTVLALVPITAPDVARGHDPESNQPWTRTRAAYLPTDLLGRITTLERFSAPRARARP